MIESLATKLKSWTQTHLSPLKIDFMSLNRLRLNQSAESVFEINIPYTEQAKKGFLDLRGYLTDTELSYENPKIMVNPFGMAPLFAVAIFYTKEPTCVSYRVKGHKEETSFSKDFSECTKMHLLPIIGLYPSEANIVTLTLFDESGSEIAQKDIVVTTGSIPYDMYQGDVENYFCFRDLAGDIRYFINMRTDIHQVIKLPNRHLACVENMCMTPNYSDKAPTHMHELDLYGFTYRTYYVGTGIDTVSYDTDAKLFYIKSHEHYLRSEDAILEMSANTGEIKKIYAASPVEQTFLDNRSFESLAALMEDISVDDFLQRFTLPPDNFSVVGWLTEPKPHKGASIQTTDSMTKDELYTRHGVRVVLAGDTINVTMHEHQIQEILFSKLDEIFQIDYSTYIDKENPVVSESYTIAIPLSELHSGTYSLIIRFANDEQAVITDALRLSRARN